MSKVTEFYVEVKTMSLEDLIHNEKNPRYIKSKKHKELMQSLKELPEMKLLREIIIDENNLILAGDKRVHALKELGYIDVTVKQVFNLSQEKKEEFIVKDNIHNGEWDTDIMANMWEPEKLVKWGVPKFNVGMDDSSDDEKPTKEPKEHTCPECGCEFSE